MAFCGGGDGGGGGGVCVGWQLHRMRERAVDEGKSVSNVMEDYGTSVADMQSEIHAKRKKQPKGTSGGKCVGQQHTHRQMQINTRAQRHIGPVPRELSARGDTAADMVMVGAVAGWGGGPSRGRMRWKARKGRPGRTSTGLGRRR